MYTSPQTRERLGVLEAVLKAFKVQAADENMVVEL